MARNHKNRSTQKEKKCHNVTLCAPVWARKCIFNSTWVASLRSIFCFIGKGISYKAKKAAAHGSSPQPQLLLLKNRYLFYECFYFVVNAFCIKLILVKQLKRRS